MWTDAHAIAVLWLAWVVTWIVTAAIFHSDRVTSDSRRALRGRGVRIPILGLVLLGVYGLHLNQSRLSADPGLGLLGVAVCALGIGIAVWARLVLRGNWGTPMSVHPNPTLTETGPYRLVRHPIYSGVGLALLGSALTGNIGWMVAFVACSAYFVVSSRVEERDMLARFPDRYPAYMARTKRLVPFVY
jgi:protein-S-isoprenylcysteine O-methyltransferase Ste14